MGVRTHSLYQPVNCTSVADPTSHHKFGEIQWYHVLMQLEVQDRALSPGHVVTNYSVLQW